MKKITKMMFATDFSQISEEALEMARTLTHELGCSLDVVHVFDASKFEMPAPYYFMPGVDQWVDDHFNGMRDRGRHAIDDLVPGLGPDCHGHFLEGNAGKVICQFADDHDIDMIVMGTHGHSGFNALVTGSVATYVIRHAHCPVLTVKGHTK